MVSPEYYKGLADRCDTMAAEAAGQGWYGLANSLYAFEEENKRRSEAEWIAMAERLRIGRPLRYPLTEARLHALRKRQLITRDEFLTFRAALDHCDRGPCILRRDHEGDCSLGT